jgi:hypothetical protein
VRKGLSQKQQSAKAIRKAQRLWFRGGIYVANGDFNGTLDVSTFLSSFLAFFTAFFSFFACFRFRPGRGTHDALDALVVGIESTTLRP